MSLARPKCRWEYSIKVIIWKDVDWNSSVQDRDKGTAVV
jgi:hypothetical protein